MKTQESRVTRMDRGEMFEALEQRIVLAVVDGLPGIADLEDPTNPVVVLETDYGDIYIELFPQDAPNSVDNFIEYIDRGLYGNSFFHRSVPGFVLQGGGFAFDNDLGLQAVFAEDLGPIADEPGRPNLARTIAYAKAGPDTATSQFYFNLDDNSASLDPQDFSVFGRVITNDSWAVVQEIVGLRVRDLRQDAAFEDQLVSRQGQLLWRDDDGQLTTVETDDEAFGDAAMGEVPVNASFSNTFDDGDEVLIVNAQVVKPEGVDRYYDQLLMIPEGFRSPNTREFLDLHNPNDEDVDVQVVVRYEEGLRDEVVFVDVLPAGESLRITLHDPADEDSPSLVAAFNPYAIEVYSAVPEQGLAEDAQDNKEPVSATLTRFDYGGAQSESLINATDPSQRSTQWDFAAVPIGEGNFSYITWQNTSDTNTTVTLQFFGQGVPLFTQTYPLDAYRRGGVAIFNQVEALGEITQAQNIAVRVASEEPIIASLSHYASQTGRPADDGEASLATGVPDGGAVAGLIPAVYIPQNGQGTLSVMTLGNAAVVTLTARRSDGSTLTATPASFIRPGNSRGEVNLANVFPSIPTGEAFTITYTSNAPVALAFSAADGATTTRQVLGSSVQTRVATVNHLSGGFLDGSASLAESISVYNPNNDTITIELEYHFSDGEVLSTGPIELQAGRRTAINTSDFTDIFSKIDSDPAFNRYGITVRGFDEFGLSERHIAAQLLRNDGRDAGRALEGVSQLATLDGDIVELSTLLFA